MSVPPEQPKIRLPRHLRQTYIRKVGEHLNLVIPFQVRQAGVGLGVRAQGERPGLTSLPPILPLPPAQGKPRPQVVWTKGGAPVDPARVLVRTSDFDTVFFVRQAVRSDSGEYELTVQIENMKDTATIRIQVVGAWPAGAGGRRCGPRSREVKRLGRKRGCKAGMGPKGEEVGVGKGLSGVRIRGPGEGAEVGRDGERR